MNNPGTLYALLTRGSKVASRTGSSFTKKSRSGVSLFNKETPDLDFLVKLEPVRDAGYQTGHHETCLTGTGESVLSDLVPWAKNPEGQKLFWLDGSAGTGKSTIAQLFSEMLFLFPGLPPKEAKEYLAYQLACRHPHFRSHIITVIKKDPTVAHTSLICQLEELLTNPLSGKAACVIIDALDECIDDQPASAILSVLGRFIHQLPLVKLFITEPQIRTAFRLPLLEFLTKIFKLHEVKLSSVDNDIRLYLTQTLIEIAKRRSGLELPNPWPSKNDIMTLTRKSSGYLGPVVVTSGEEVDQELYSFWSQKSVRRGYRWERYSASWEWQALTHIERLSLVDVGGNLSLVCVNPFGGARWTRDEPYSGIADSPLLDTATSVAASSNNNLVVQTKDSIQVFSIDILTNYEARNDAHPSYVYPGRKSHDLYPPTNRLLSILDLATLRERRPGHNILTLKSLLMNRSPSVRFSHWLIAEFGVSVVLQAWRSGTPLPEATDEDGLSPGCTLVATFYGSPQRELRVKDVMDGTVASLPLGNDELRMGEVYDVIFDSETSFFLKIDGPGGHVQITYVIIASPTGQHSHTIIKGELVPLQEPRARPHTNYEWVFNARFRKIYWFSPSDLRRGNGGFWAGLSLVMVGGDGVVRKVSFKEPDF